LAPGCNSNQSTSVQFNGYLLTCKLNRATAWHYASTKTQIQHKTIQIHKSRRL